MQREGGHGHPPGIYIKDWHPINKLLLKDGFEEGRIQIQELIPAIHPNQSCI